MNGVEKTIPVLDLFSGIGGFHIGLEKTGGFRTIAFCECDSEAQKQLQKHWPDIPVFKDVRTLHADDLPEKPMVITGGFPCQDISPSGKKKGIDGRRSGLWKEYERIIGEVRPKYAIVENSSALLNRGIWRVLGGLASIGYDAEWHCIPACAFGADHKRDRAWIVAYPEGERRESILQQSGLFQKAVENSTRLASSRRTFYCTNAKRILRETESGICRVNDESSNRIHRIKMIGNMVYWPIVEAIGKSILVADGRC